jgi:uncharacterized protein YndB with AHSA1/START domain
MKELEYGTEEWFRRFPDSVVVFADRSTRHVDISVRTGTEATELELWVTSGLTHLVEAKYNKAPAVDRVIFRWDMTDANGKRVPPGYYCLMAVAGVRTEAGVVKLAE